MKKEKYSELFLYLSIVFIVCLLLSNILAAKILKIGELSATAGIIIFPISYIINDIFSEVYGYKKTKKIIIFGFLMNLFMVIVFMIAIHLPSPIWYKNAEAFKTILSTTPRTCLASLTAYLFGSLVNSKILVNMKNKENNKFGVRAIVSSLYGELVDSIIFVFIAFIGSLDIKNILIMIIVQVVLKTSYEAICLPITTLIVNKVKVYEKDL